MTEQEKPKTDDHNSQALEPRLKEQIETSLYGVYRFNAATAKYGIVWVGLLKLLELGSAGFAILSLALGLILLTGTDIRLGTELVFFDYQWLNAFLAGAAGGAGWWFFHSVGTGIQTAYAASKKMADQYTKE